MEWYGEHVARVLREHLTSTPQTERTPVIGVGTILRPQVVQTKGPGGSEITMADRLAEAATTGGRRRSGWMTSIAQQRGAPVHARPRTGVITYDGRVCCYELLRSYDDRQYDRFPVEITCPTCGSEYEIRLQADKR